MEDSAKRKERLQALREEAAGASTGGDFTAAGSLLGNPFADSPASSSASPAARRFDFYTDPMSSFSPADVTGRPARPPPPHAGFWNQDVSASVPATPQFHVNHSFAQGSYQSSSSSQSAQWRGTPPNFGSPNSAYRGTQFSPSWGRIAGSSGPGYSSHTSTGDSRSPSFCGEGIPFGYRSPNIMHGGKPRSSFGLGGGRMNHSGGTSEHDSSGRGGVPIGCRSPSIMHGGNPRSNFGVEGGTMNYSSGTSGHYSSGRGRGRSDDHSRIGRSTPLIHSGGRSSNSNSGRSYGRSGGRARIGGNSEGSGSHFSHTQKPMAFYKKSMLEDPWKDLKPVIGNILVALSGEHSRYPKSLTKKPKFAETRIEVSSSSSLAECLAQSFEEALNDDIQA